MENSTLDLWILSSLLLSLRIAPALAFAPPFSLFRVPAQFRVLFGLALAALLAAANPQTGQLTDVSVGIVVATGARELFLGLIMVLGLQIPFAALQLAGRTIDVQAGMGFAAVIDPTTRTQSPLTGTLFAYAAGAVFFGMEGHLEVLRILASSLDAVPLGHAEAPASIAGLTTFVSLSFVLGFGVGGIVILSLFLTDMAITLMSRTVPQMNVLVLGFQVKTIVLLTTLPLALGVSAALLARLISYALRTLPMLF